MIGGVDFQEKEHLYFREGVNVPSLSTLLSFLKLNPYTNFYKPEHAIRGTYVHKLSEFIDLGELDWEELDPKLRPYAEAYQEFLNVESPMWIYSEQILFNETLWYAGTLDRAGIFRGCDSILDIKSGNGGTMPKHGIQTAGYDMALGGNRRKRWILFLRPNGTYKLEEYNDIDDYKVIEKGAWLYNWSKRKNLT